MSNTLRNVVKVVRTERQIEGGGFVVRRPFPVPGLSFVDPFLLLDEMGPATYAPGEAVGAPDHPHRGFETVTYMLDGEFEHEDSAGHKGKLTPGDVQWMTAGSGVIHAELPSARISKEGGRVHGFQLWVNLPAKDKMMAPRYQELPASGIPRAESDDGKVAIRVLAGEALGVRAAIETRTPIGYLDVTLAAGGGFTQAIPTGHTGLVYVFGGAVLVDGQRVADGELAVLGDGDAVTLAAPDGAIEPARFLILHGAPLREPVARYGPFVMNTGEEIHQAIRDFQTGRFAQIRR